MAANLTSVSQGSQQRSFAYDGLGRLVCASNPESRIGTTSCLTTPLPTSGVLLYQYDLNGNLTKRTNARGVVAEYSYDELNRVKLKKYTEAQLPPGQLPTPNATYCYDGLTATGTDGACTGSRAALSVGQLTQVRSSAATTTYPGYDALGRVTASSQTVDGTTYAFGPNGTAGYAYNLADGLTSLTMPSGRVVTYAYDTAGRVSAVNKASGGSYASNITYSAHGAPAHMQLGNALWENRCYNWRLQPAVIGVGSSAAQTSTCSDNAGWSVLQLGYDFGTGSNNGNVLTETINAAGTVFTQSYSSYDGVNRLHTATDSGGWSRTFDYDQYGNGRVAGTGIPLSSFTPTTTGWYDTTNRLVNAALGITYDDGGNQKSIGAYGFGYDAENRQISATTGTLSALYIYDGDGRRVKKVINGATAAVYVYDASGALAAEYGTPAAASGTQYLTEDHLGSTRLVTSAAGQVVARHDYLPFGEEIYAGSAGRTTQLGYPAAPDDLELKFTGKERDSESGLDYFGARYLSSAQGRWTSPDEPFADFSLGDPQRWNFYAYVRNNPLRFIDPDGRCEKDGTDGHGNACYETTGRPRSWFGRLIHSLWDDRAAANARSTVNFGVDLLNLTPAGLLYGGLAGHPGLEQMRPANAEQARIMRANDVGLQITPLLGELEISQEAAALTNGSKALASDLQVQEIMSGAGTPLAGAGTGTKLRDAAILAAKYGGEEADWVKIGSSSSLPPGGAGGWEKAGFKGSFEVHAYQNVKTGEIVELKTKFQ